MDDTLKQIIDGSDDEPPAPPVAKIAALTGLSHQTLYGWRRSRPHLWHIIVLGTIVEMAILDDE